MDIERAATHQPRKPPRIWGVPFAGQPLAMDVALVAMLAVLLFVPSISGGFVWDDHLLIEEDTRIRTSGGLVHSLVRPFLADSEHLDGYGYWRPAVTLSYGLQWWTSGADPLPYHVFNVLAHAAVVVLVYLLAASLGLSRSARFAAVLAFAVMPSHAESVAWIAGRTDLLAGLGVLLALWLDRRDARIGTAMAFTLALCSKELSVMTPLVAMLLRPGRPLQDWLPWVVPGVLWLVARAVVGGSEGSPGTPDGFAEWMQTAPVAIWHYAGIVGGWTRPHPYHQLPLLEWWSTPQWWGGLAVLLWGASVSVAAPRAGRLVLGAGLLMLPSMNLVRLSAPVDMGFPVADRLVYVPWALICIGFGLGVDEVATRLRPATAARSLVLGALVLWACLQVPRLIEAQSSWRSDVVLFSRSLVTRPDAPLLQHWLVESLRREGRLEDARRHAQRFAREHLMAGERLPARLHASLVSLVAEDLAPSELVYTLRAAMEGRDEATIESNEWFNLGVAEHRAGDAQGAERAWQRALDARPGHVGALAGLGLLAVDEGDARLARQWIEELRAVDPTHASIDFLQRRMHEQDVGEFK